MKEEQLKRLMESLSTEEKIGQLVQLSGDFYTEDEALKVGPQQKLGICDEVIWMSGSVLNVTGAKKVREIQDRYLKASRHKIPLLFMADVVYGYRTVYPIPLGLGASWNTELVKEGYEITAREAKAAGVHVTFSPMVDLVRDARWGRCLESTGEDAWLNGLFARAMVTGFQGENLAESEGIASCVKHFAGYGAVEGGREYNTVDMSEWRLRQEYLPSYKAAVEAGCKLVMTSFNTIGGIPATGNKWLMDQVLRKEWGFDGVVITDYAAIQELIAHGVAEDAKEAACLAMEAGVDIDMKTACYSNQLKPLLEEGKITMEMIDRAVWRVLKLKNELGLFEDPYRGADEEEERRLCCSPDHREAARKLAGQAAVLLENRDGLLPLNRDAIKKAALIGPYGDSKDLMGLWAVHGNADDTVTLREALLEVLGEDRLVTAKGCSYLEDESALGLFGRGKSQGTDSQQDAETAKEMWQEAIDAAGAADVVIMALGEHPRQSGEGGSRTQPDIPKIQRRLLEEVRELGKPVVLILFSGRPLILTDIRQQADAIIEAWFPGTEGGHGLADILFGNVNPSGRLTMSFPRCAGQMPVYYNHFQTGRPAEGSSHSSRFTSRYLDCPNEPLYPFGYGLSYHKASYGSVRLSSDRMGPEETLRAWVEVVNESDVDGVEIVQMYIRDVSGSVVRPVKELKGFCRLQLKAGERRTAEFEIRQDMLKFYGKDMEFKAEPGKFQVMIGKNSQDTRMAEFIFECNLNPLEEK